MSTMAIAGREMERMQAPSSRRTARVAQRNREIYEQQRARRRGPTPEMLFTKHIDNTRMVKSDDPERRREMISFTFTMTLLFALTMVYVWQHFSAIEVGYNVEGAKQRVEQMREENRKLRLTEAELSGPSRIDHIARQLGMDEPLPGQVVRQDEPNGSVVAQTQNPALPND